MKKTLPLLIVLTASLLTSASAQELSLLRRGEVLRWTADNGQSGTMRVVAADGALFEVEQTNEFNRAAGVVRLYGASIDWGTKVVLLNVGPWKEVWEGTFSPNETAGTISAGTVNCGFRIRPASLREDGRALFAAGRTLHWKTGAVSMEGEIREGRICIYNKRWNETWVGAFAHGTMVGKVNGQTEFRIFE